LLLSYKLRRALERLGHSGQQGVKGQVITPSTPSRVSRIVDVKNPVIKVE
jgi:hypothetical protein